MLDLHQKRHPWEHERSRVLKDLNNFIKADKDPNPRCLLGKEWQQIKLDLIDEVMNYIDIIVVRSFNFSVGYRCTDSIDAGRYDLDQEPFKGQMRFSSYPQRHFLSHTPDARFFISGQQVLYGTGSTSAVPEYDAAAEAMTSRSLCLPLPVGQDRSISRSCRVNAGSRKPEL